MVELIEETLTLPFSPSSSSPYIFISLIQL